MINCFNSRNQPNLQNKKCTRLFIRSICFQGWVSILKLDLMERRNLGIGMSNCCRTALILIKWISLRLNPSINLLHTDGTCSPIISILSDSGLTSSIYLATLLTSNPSTLNMMKITRTYSMAFLS